ncbi:MAG TPA: hypothetical protein VL197_17125 [Nitrospirota bacterium]|nr:hypothetical protein [Nitrospirota bacterium]
MDQTTADVAIKKAWMAGIISGVLTLIVTLAAMSGHSIMGFTALNLVDAVLIFGLSFGIYKKSRTCAVIMLIYFIGSKIYLWKETGSLAGFPLAALFGYYFYQGVTGTFDYHSNADAPATPAAKSTPAPVPKFKTREEYEQWKAERLTRPPGASPVSDGANVQTAEKKSSSFGWAIAVVVAATAAAVLLFSAPGKALLSKASIPETPSWAEFSSPEGNFSILMPGTPAQEKKQVSTAAGLLDMHMFSREVRNRTAYIVIYTDYPDAITRVSPDKVLDGGRDGAVANSKGKLLSEQYLFLEGGHSGREITVEVPEKGMLKVRAYLVRQRLYQIMLIAPKELIDSEDNVRYLSSFKLK